MKKHILFLVFVCLSCKQQTFNKEMVSGQTQGTTYHITYFSEVDFPIEKGLDSIFERVNQSMSTYLHSSDISRLNRGGTVKVDSLFQQVFEYSKKVYNESNGYFDPTVGDLVNMYGFGPEKRLVKIDSNTIDSLMKFVGLNMVKINQDGTVIKKFPQIFIDFNAIAQGYTVDLVAHYLDGQGVENYLIEIGGELIGKGKNLITDATWRIGIDDPKQQEGNRTFMAVVVLNNRAMATSGNYRKSRIDSLTGEKYVHTVNPLTGYPQTSKLLSATVFAKNCALADAYATAFMAMGLEKSKKFLKELKQVDVYFIYSEEDELKEFVTEGVKVK